MNAVVIVFIAVTVGLALVRKVPVFDEFLAGVKEGAQALVKIAPSLFGLLFAVSLLKASGTLSLISSFLTPLLSKLGFPSELVPMALLRPVSGSASTALLMDVFHDFGPDSLIGRVASVLAGSSETTFYAVSMYFGCIGVRRLRHTLAAAIAADLTAFIMSAVTVRLLFYSG